MPQAIKTSRWLRWVLIGVAGALGLAAAAFIVFSFGGPDRWLEVFSDNATVWRASTQAHPIVAVVGFISLLAAVIVAFVPVAMVMIAISGFLFGPIVGAAASVSGLTLAAAIGYFIGRRTLAPGARRRARRHQGKIERLLKGFRKDTFGYALSLRLLPLTPFGLVSMAAGAARARFTPFLLGTALGVTPEAVLYASMGRGIGHILGQGRVLQRSDLTHPWILWPLAGLGLLTLAGVAYRGARV